jgi:pre-mRNA-processing factor 17
MPLVEGYSSDEDIAVDISDAFGLSSLPATKKPKLDNDTVDSKTGNSAPHVLAEVLYYLSYCFHRIQLNEIIRTH